MLINPRTNKAAQQQQQTWGRRGLGSKAWERQWVGVVAVGWWAGSDVMGGGGDDDGDRDADEEWEG